MTADISTTSETTTPAPSMSLFDWLTIALVLACLAAGWSLGNAIENRLAIVTTGTMALAYPANWTSLPETEPGTIFAQRGTYSESPFQPTITLRTETISETVASGGIEALLAQRTIAASQRLAAYRGLGKTSVQVGSVNGIASDYAYLFDSSNNALVSSVPVIVRAQELLLPVNQTLYVLTFTTDADDWEAMQPVWERIKSTIAFRQ